MNKNTLIIVLIAIIVLIGLATVLPQIQRNEISQLPIPTAAPRTGETTPTVSGVMEVTLLSQSSEFSQSGVATLTEVNGKVNVQINVNSVDGQNDQPTHIHLGSCPKPGDVLYPLTNVVNGRSMTVINTTLTELRRQLPLAINIHKSTQESSIYTACGDLR